MDSYFFAFRTGQLILWNYCGSQRQPACSHFAASLGKSWPAEKMMRSTQLFGNRNRLHIRCKKWIDSKTQTDRTAESSPMEMDWVSFYTILGSFFIQMIDYAQTMRQNWTRLEQSLAQGSLCTCPRSNRMTQNRNPSSGGNIVFGARKARKGHSLEAGEWKVQPATNKWFFVHYIWVFKNCLCANASIHM